MTDALRLLLASQLLRANPRGAYQSRSPLLNLIYSKTSVALSLLQLAQTSLALQGLGVEEVLKMAERTYAQALGYVELLPKDELTSAVFTLGQLRSALDEFRRS